MPRYPLRQLETILKQNLCQMVPNSPFSIYYDPKMSESISIFCWIGKGQNASNSILAEVYSNCDYKFSRIIDINRTLTLYDALTFEANQYLSYLLQRTFAMMF